MLPPEERAHPLEAYFRRILDPDPAVHGPAARAWGETERILSEHKPTAPGSICRRQPSRALPATPFMEAHYFANNCFMRPDQLIDEAGKLAGIPGIIVQGRYDLLCPPATSHALAAVWREAEIRIVEGAGHTLYDPGVRGRRVSRVHGRVPGARRRKLVGDGGLAEQRHDRIGGRVYR